MAVKRTILVALLAAAVQTSPARGQSLSVEADVTAGYSTDEVVGVATQVRAFGDLKAGVRFYLEGAWARRSHKETDAFAAAYPYGGRVEAIETYGERLFMPGKALIAVRGGRYRTPFGLASRSDHAYSGFLRAPLIRYDDYYALSNTFLEHGADIVAGVPQLYAEASVGAPADVGDVKRRRGFDTVFRVQGYHGAWIVGASHLRTQPTQPASYAQGRAVFTGIDLRYAQDGLLVRGEWITGQPFDGTHTDGWYVDAMLHRVFMGPVTAVVRAEQLGYDADAPFSLQEKRLTLGAKVRLPRGLTAQVDVLRQSGDLPNYRSVPLDLALTYSVRLR